MQIKDRKISMGIAEIYQLSIIYLAFGEYFQRSGNTLTRYIGYPQFSRMTHGNNDDRTTIIGFLERVATTHLTIQILHDAEV